jgi:hypothetical protein
MRDMLHLPLSALVTICLGATAFAAPPETEAEVEILSEKIEEKLSDHKIDIAKSTARLKRKLEKGQAKADGDISEEIEVVMDVMEEAFAEDGLFRDLAAMFSDFAQDIDVDTDNGQTVLSFDGAKIAEIKKEKSRDSEDSFSISGLGKSMTIDRETIVKDGKSKTRIVIDMEGEDEIDITLPNALD